MGKTNFPDKPPENWLLALRNGVATFDFCKKELFRTLALNNKTLADVGSNQEELEQLQVQNPRKVAVNYAKFWFKKINSEGNSDPRCKIQLDKLISEFQLSMNEIDGSE